MFVNRGVESIVAIYGEKFSRYLFSSLLGLVLLSAADARAQKKVDKIELPPSHTASYHLYKGIVILAKTQRSFKRDKDNHYIFSSYTEPTGVGRMLTSAKIKERSLWIWKDQTAIPLEYSYVNSSEDKRRDVKLIFNWEQYKVTNIINGDPWTMDLVPRIQDKLLYQFSLMLELQKGAKQFTFYVADGGKMKNYSGRVIDEEVVATDLGKFHTVVVLREHDGKTTKFWCAKDMHFLPVQIERTNKNGSTVTARLYDIQGMKVPRFEDPDW